MCVCPNLLRLCSVPPGVSKGFGSDPVPRVPLIPDRLRAVAAIVVSGEHVLFMCD